MRQSSIIIWYWPCVLALVIHLSAKHARALHRVSIACQHYQIHTYRFILHTQRICISAEERRLWLVNSFFFPQCNSTTDNLYRIIAFGMLVAANYVLSVPNKQ